MIIQDIINVIEEMSPLHYAESFDNVGLLVGDSKNKLTGVLVTLDTLENVIEEAIEKDCNLVVSFHPIIFSGLKKITGKNYVERVVIKAIQNNISIFSMHTALDNEWLGVNHQICKKLNLINEKILIPKKETICKLQTYVPKKNASHLKKSLFEIGAGSLGNYEECSFSTDGLGSFKANDQAAPYIGEINKIHHEEETSIQITFESHLKNKVIKTLITNHPYEEVAYEISTLENINQKKGMGRIGELEKEISEHEALQLVKDTFKCKNIRHSAFTGKKIKKIAVLGGSGAFAIGAAKANGADLYITSDIKYHEYYQAENKLIIADIGHYESEQYTKNLIVDYLKEKISKFAPAYDLSNIVLSYINTNPIKYF